jgi:hypothetical protein
VNAIPDSGLAEAPLIPEQALATVQKQATAIKGTISARVFNFNLLFIENIAL